MSTWRNLEKDFRDIPDPFNDLRADWSHQKTIPNHWRLMGSSLRSAGDRFEQIAKLAGKALLSDRAIISILPEEVTQEEDPFKRWLTALRLMTKRFKHEGVITTWDVDDRFLENILTGTVYNVIESSALLCLQLAVEEVPSFQASIAPQVHIDDSFRDERKIAIFPTPAGVSWVDVLIRFKDGHTVSIQVKSAGGVYNYTQMGMANRKNSNPTKQWELLNELAEHRGQIDWKNSPANHQLKKQKQELSDRLKHFFRLDGDPIIWDKKNKCYRCRFRILPEG